ncbi:hypothetical protein CVD28_01520 [Bacillus sp. M6-12]|uniref:hypothetical protein n=1 Tax=Bacillus sp. M6-12 TaxID=2054166 RepID=UPI000C77C811|nr:hypothetical protein [Bacillus sp. M6-12]PLS19114.1 hypothetical protein CVD28_01520 [Bacillus sp. M6-12]
MSRGKKALICSVVVAILSFLLMKGMYIIDPIGSDTGMLTAFVFIFINVPIWIMSGMVFLYGVFVMVKDKKTGYEPNETLDEIVEEDISDREEIEVNEEKEK